MIIHANTCTLCMDSLRDALQTDAAMFDTTGRYLASTNQQRAAAFQQAYASLSGREKEERIIRFFKEGYPYCEVLFPDAKPCAIQTAFVHMVLQTALDQQILRDQTDNDFSDRLYFINRITTLGSSEREALPVFALQLKYDPQVPRCAICFQVAACGTRQEEVRPYFLQAVRGAPYFHNEDIFEMVSADRMVVFKFVPEGLDNGGLTDALTAFTNAVLDTTEQGAGVTLSAGIGSVYPDIAHQHESFDEACFVLSNQKTMGRGQRLSFIQNHVFDYFCSLLPADYWQRKFRRYMVLDQEAVLSDTLMNLTKNSVNLASTAKDMGVHRNTMMKRYARLCELLDLDLQGKDQDRLEARQYALFRKRRTILHAGTNIQYGSVPYLGFQKFAEFVAQLSDGSLQIDVHVLSYSGDNQHLVDILRSGSLDFAAFDFNALAPLTQNRITLFQLPFLFDTSAEAFDILNGDFGRYLAEDLPASGLCAMGYWSMGWRMLTTSRRPIHRPEDLRGLRIRIMHKDIVAAYFSALGAIPVKMHYKDISSALAQHLIDGQENPYSNITGMKLYQNQGYVSEIPMFFDVVMFLATQLALGKLSSQQREWIGKAAELTNQWQNSTVIGINADCKEELLNKGLKVVPFEKQTLPAWLESVKPFYQAFEPKETLGKFMKAKEEYHASRSAANAL